MDGNGLIGLADISFNEKLTKWLQNIWASLSDGPEWWYIELLEPDIILLARLLETTSTIDDKNKLYEFKQACTMKIMKTNWLWYLHEQPLERTCPGKVLVAAKFSPKPEKPWNCTIWD